MQDKLHLFPMVSGWMLLVILLACYSCNHCAAEDADDTEDWRTTEANAIPTMADLSATPDETISNSTRNDPLFFSKSTAISTTPIFSINGLSFSSSNVTAVSTTPVTSRNELSFSSSNPTAGTTTPATSSNDLSFSSNPTAISTTPATSRNDMSFFSSNTTAVSTTPATSRNYFLFSSTNPTAISTTPASSRNDLSFSSSNATTPAISRNDLLYNYPEFNEKFANTDSGPTFKSSLNQTNETYILSRKMIKKKKLKKKYHQKLQNLLNIENTNDKKRKQVKYSSAEFVIKNIYCGKYIHPKDHPHFYNGDKLVLWQNTNYQTHYVFDRVDGIWGYIRQTISGKVWHPYGGPDVATKDSTKLCLHSDRERWALFAIDEVNNHIIHRYWSYVHFYHSRDPHPPNGANIILHHGVHDAMKWQLLNPNNHSEEVKPYGPAHISDEWGIVYEVLNPKAKHIWQYKYYLGKSIKESTKSWFQFKFETSVSAKTEFLTASMSSSLSSGIEKASTKTWSEEIEITTSVEIYPGSSVVVWQKRFIGEQIAHKAVYQSNIFADTNSIDIKPDENNIIYYKN